MKKIASLLLALVLCVALCVPAMAKGTGTKDDPYVTAPNDYGKLIMDIAKYHIIKESCEATGFSLARDATVIIDEGVNVTVTLPEVLVMPTIIGGTLIISKGASLKFIFTNDSQLIQIDPCATVAVHGTLDAGESIDKFRVASGTTVNVYCDGEIKGNFSKSAMINQNVHTYKNGVCTDCNFACPHDGNTCVVCGKELHSLGNGGNYTTLPEGGLTIVCSVACLAVGALGMYLVMKKKKPALADGAENKDEE